MITLRSSHITCCALGLALAGCGDDGGSAGIDAGERDGAPPADSGAGTLTVTTFLGADQSPLVWFAVQDGDSDWRRVNSSDGVYSIDLSSPRWGIAYVCMLDDQPTLDFFYSTLPEHSSLTRACPVARTPGTAPVTIQVNGLDGNGQASVADIFFNSGMTMADPNTVHDLPPGTNDFLFTVVPDSTVITRFALRTLDLVDATPASLTLDATTDTVPVATHTATATNPQGRPVGSSCRFLTARGVSIPLNQGAAGYATVPLATTRDGDLHEITASITFNGAGANDPDFLLSATAYRRTGSDVILTLPEPIALEPAVAATAPYIQLSFAIDAVAAAQIYVVQGSPPTFGDPVPRTRFTVTPGWLDGASRVELVQPDFTGVEDWLDAYGIPSNAAQISWNVVAAHTDGASPILGFVESPAVGPKLPPAVDGETLSRLSASGFFDLGSPTLRSQR